MPTIIPTSPIARTTRSLTRDSRPTLAPHYDCDDTGDGLKLTVYVPGVAASGVEIVNRGPDLLITARKEHLVRVNWQAMNLESVQRDYLLRLRLGDGYDYESLQADLAQGVLTLTLPRKVNAGPSESRLGKVA